MSAIQTILYRMGDAMKPFDSFGRYGLIAGLVAFGLISLNILRQYISVRRVRPFFTQSELTRIASLWPPSHSLCYRAL